MIDHEGFRANVGIILINRQNRLFWARRIRQHSWQFPQGGIHENETVLAALYRELREEVGLVPTDVALIGITKSWLKYRLPEEFRKGSEPYCIGQKQKWCLLRLLSHEKSIDLALTSVPEFDGWRWVDYWYPLAQVIPFKRHVYRRALENFYPIIKKERQKLC